MQVKLAALGCIILLALIPLAAAYSGPKPLTDEWRQMYYHKEPLPVESPGIVETIFSVLQAPAVEPSPVIPAINNIRREVVERDEITKKVTVKIIELPPLVSLDVLNKQEWKTETGAFIKGDR